MAAQGEVFDPATLWSPTSAKSVEFSNRLALAIGQLPPGIGSYAGYLSGLDQAQPGLGRRGSQEPKPFLEGQKNLSTTWEDLSKCMHQAQPALQSLRALMQDPPPEPDYDIVQRLESDLIPNYVNVRRGAQALHAAVIQDLHCGDLEAAQKDISALSAFVELHEGDPTLVCFMIRVAILGLSVDAYWDALQASCWTEPQLAALQKACRCDKLLLQMPRAMAAERVVRLSQLRWFRSHSYEEWAGKYQEIYQSFGGSIPSSGTNAAVRLWRERFFHPTWRFASADQEQLNYLCHVQDDLEILRRGAEQGSWITLGQQMAARHRIYRPPVASWRFYTRMPFVDYFSEVIGPSPFPAPYPYPDFSRAWFVTMKNLTLNQMVSTVIALKRYQLRHGRLPAALAALVPDFLPVAPRDYMDGQPLRYRGNSDGSFTLYSVAEDAVDDGGDPSSADSPNLRQPARPWTGRDWVWPRSEK